MQLIDLRHLGRERVIGSWLVGDVLIDPGPESCMQTLLQGLDGREVRVIALTHIHLDHAGASGALIGRFPEAEVWVHQRGARHLLDPARLLASAERLYGDQMQHLWGRVLPVPADRVRALSGGERIGGFEVAYTPGHASHHVCYLHVATRTAFCGDVAGVRIVSEAPVLAPTPPPDIDLDAWRSSLQTVAAWRPQALVATHFGRYEDVEEHVEAAVASLAMLERLAAEDDEALFARVLQQHLDPLPPHLQDVYKQAMPFDQTFAGLRRYLERTA